MKHKAEDRISEDIGFVMFAEGLKQRGFVLSETPLQTAGFMMTAQRLCLRHDPSQLSTKITLTP